MDNHFCHTGAGISIRNWDRLGWQHEKSTLSIVYIDAIFGSDLAVVSGNFRGRVWSAISPNSKLRARLYKHPATATPSRLEERTLFHDIELYADSPLPRNSHERCRILRKNRYFTVRMLCLLAAAVFSLSLFTAGTVDAAEVTLAWDPNKESDLAGYCIHYGTSSGVYNRQIDVGNVTRYTITNLTDGQRYYFAATAYDRNRNESALSKEVVLDPSTANDPPSTSNPAYSGGGSSQTILPVDGLSRYSSSPGHLYFDLSSLSRPLEKVVLRLYSISPSQKATVYFWGRQIKQLSALANERWYEIDVTEQVAGRRTCDFSVYCIPQSGIFSYGYTFEDAFGLAELVVY